MKAEKGKEIRKDVKTSGFIGTKKKTFCCSEHADNYEKGLKENLKTPKKCKGGCCG